MLNSRETLLGFLKFGAGVWCRFALSRGVIYVTADEHSFLEEAKQSANSLKQTNPEIDVALFTNAEEVEGPFDNILPLEDPEHSFIDKIAPMKESPYDETVFLDTDTYVCGDITPLFDLLDRFDIAAAHAPERVSRPTPGVPSALPEYNTGVIAYRNTEDLRAFFDDWLSIHKEKRGDTSRMGDQAAFRQSLYQSDLSIGTIPPEYNCRFVYPGYVQGEVAVLHGRHPDMPAMAEALNRRTGKRAFTGNAHRRIYAYPMPVKKVRYPGPTRTEYKIRALLRDVREYGFKHTIMKLAERMR